MLVLPFSARQGPAPNLGFGAAAAAVIAATVCLSLVAPANATTNGTGAPAAESGDRCLPPSNLTYIGEGKNLTLEQNDWLGHAVTTQTAALLLREVLGFDVRVVETPMTWGDPADNPLSRLDSGGVDANLEAWEIDWPTDLMARYVDQAGSVERSIHEFQGRVGIYTPKFVVDDNPSVFPDYWRSFTLPEVLDLYRWGEEELALLRDAFADNCNAAAYGCVGGEWRPPQCDDSTNCIPIFHVVPEYAVGWIEQLIINLNLNASVFYAGWDVYDLVRLAMEVRKPVLFYSWRPHEFLAAQEFVRVTFPEQNQVCQAADTDSRFGGRDCDHEGRPVFKLTTRTLGARSSAAHDFIHRRFSLGLQDQNTMLAMLAAGGHGGTLTPEEAACAWARDNTAKIEEWVRVLSGPPPDCARISEDQIGQFPISQQGELRELCFAEAPSLMHTLLPVIGGLFGALLVVVLAMLGRRQYKRYKKAMEAEAKALAERKMRVVRAVEKTYEMSFSFCLVRFDHFCAMNGMIIHELARENAKLTTLDTFEDAVDFAHKHPVAFLSHQWLSKNRPDPQNQQYNAVVTAGRQLCEKEGIPPDGLFLWCDFLSIPQANRAMQKASVSTISLYAACCKYFIAVVPPAKHIDTGEVADGTTYSGRGWCRLEQVAYILIHGHDHAYLCDGSLKPLSEQWIREAIGVFEGSFSQEEDRFLLVDVLLGLFGMAILSSEEQGSYGSLIRLIIENKCRVFPVEFFSDLVALLEQELEEGKRSFCRTKSIDIAEPTGAAVADVGNKPPINPKNSHFGFLLRRENTMPLDGGSAITVDSFKRIMKARKSFAKITGRQLVGEQFRRFSEFAKESRRHSRVSLDKAEEDDKEDKNSKT